MLLQELVISFLVRCRYRCAPKCHKLQTGKVKVNALRHLYPAIKHGADAEQERYVIGRNDLVGQRIQYA